MTVRRVLSALLVGLVATSAVAIWAVNKHVPPIYWEASFGVENRIRVLDDLMRGFMAEEQLSQLTVSPDGLVRAVDNKHQNRLIELDVSTELAFRELMKSARVSRITKIDDDIEFLIDSTTKSGKVFLSGVLFSSSVGEALSSGAEDRCSLWLFINSDSGQCSNQIREEWYESYRWFRLQ